MSDTIHYEGKIKRGKDPVEVFQKISRGIKKKGPTKDWVCVVDEEEEYLRITFSGNSEDFVLHFDEKGAFYDFCKVDFLDREDGTDEFHALIDAIYNAKSMFSRIELTDDYGLAEEYWDSKRFKIKFRELTQEEKERVLRLYSAGYTTHERLLLAIMAEDMEMSVDELTDYINIDIPFFPVPYAFPKVFQTLGSYLYETAEYQKEGRLCELSELTHYDLGAVGFSEFAFVEGLSWVFFDGTGYGTSINLEKKPAFGQKVVQVNLLFREKFAPELMKTEDPIDRCLLVYRYFVSVYDYLGFKYVGRARNLKTVFDEIMEEYGEERGLVFWSAHCTLRHFMRTHMSGKEYDKYVNKIYENLKRRYGESMAREYLEFERRYNKPENARFRQEVEYMREWHREYIDESLVQ